MRCLIINADGYGFTAGITRAIEECVEFGTVRSLSANVNFPHADGLADLVRKHPDISVGCHVNPIVGKPVMPPQKVQTLLDDNGEFFYKTFMQRYFRGKIKLAELRAEMTAQLEKTRALAGEAFSHVDFHMGLHRLPGLYDVFLDVVEKSGVGRIRTHKYRVGLEHKFPRLRHSLYLFETFTRIPKYVYILWLRKKALQRGLAMPDLWVGISHMKPQNLIIENYLMMLKNMPCGINEFVAHPGYVDEELKRWSSYHESRTLELGVLLSPRFRDALDDSGVRFIGYRDIPLRQAKSRKSLGASSKSVLLRK
jgi:chitin disaccharide deacetylase